MPERNNAPRGGVVQPARFTSCLSGCGATVAYRTSNKVRCDECRKSGRRESLRRAAERQRRKLGIAPVKGTSAICAGCQKSYARPNLKSRYCDTCKPSHYAEKARRRSRAKYATQEGRDYANTWFKTKRKKDPAFGVNASMRVLMHRALRGKKQGRTWLSFVPYTLAELMVHLERQFLPGMTWENRGQGWHIDHIQSLSSFTFSGPDDPEFKACWALSNLRPLWKPDNLSKNARRTLLI